MISVCASVPRSSLRTKPLRYEFGAEEVLAIAAANGEIEEQEEIGREESKHDAHRAAQTMIPGFPDELQLSDDDDDDIIGGIDLNDNDDMRDDDDDDDDEDGNSDGEDDELKATDSVFLTANTDDDYSSIEMHVYDEETQNLYVHHDIALPAFPLALESIRLLDPETNTLDGCFVAVGSFDPGIEIWNLDVLDALEPRTTLGGYGKPVKGSGGVKGKKKKGLTKRRGELKPGSHSDAVMDLSWNRVRGDILASGGADMTVKIWDLSTQQCATTFTHHTAKVQGVAWHPVEAAALATGSHDRTMTVRDCRASLEQQQATTMPLSADLECMAWNPHDAAQLLASTEDGVLVCYDLRSPTTPLWRFEAHKKPASAFAFSNKQPGLMASCSTDGTVKLWNCLDNAGQPALVAEKTMAIGQIFSLCFDHTSPFLLAAGGSKGILALWDTTENPQVEATFQPQQQTQQQEAAEDETKKKQPSLEDEYLAA